MGAADPGFSAGKPRRADHGRPAACSSRFGLGTAGGTPCPGHMGRTARRRGAGASSVLGSARRPSAAAARIAGAGPDVGHPGIAASCIGRSSGPDLGRARGACRRRCSSSLAPDWRAGTGMGGAPAARCARRSILADAFRSGVGSARARPGARVGRSGRAGSRVGSTARTARTACRTTGRALASRHAGGTRLGHARA